MEQSTSARPKNWLVESILATLFCCLPFGIVGIINAAKVNSAFDGGDVAGAMKASADAKKWTRISFIIGIVMWIILIAWYGYMFYAMSQAGMGLEDLENMDAAH